MQNYQIHCERSAIEPVLRNDIFSKPGKYYYTESRISSLQKDFPLQSCSSLHICIPTSAFDFTVCECRQPSLSSIIHLWRLFNSRRSPGSPSCRALLSPTFSPVLSFFFPFTSLFRLLSPHVCFPFMPQTFHPLLRTSTTNPPLFTSPPILRYPISTRAWQAMGVSLLLPSPPPATPPNPLPQSLSLPHYLSLSCQGNL